MLAVADRILLPILAYSHAHSSGWTDWIAHRAVSAVIHAVIYGAVFKLMRQMTMGERSLWLLAWNQRPGSTASAAAI